MEKELKKPKNEKKLDKKWWNVPAGTSMGECLPILRDMDIMVVTTQERVNKLNLV